MSELLKTFVTIICVAMGFAIGFPVMLWLMQVVASLLFKGELP